MAECEVHGGEPVDTHGVGDSVGESTISAEAEDEGHMVAATGRLVQRVRQRQATRNA